MTQPTKPKTPPAPLPPPPEGSAIRLWPDGVYRWTYEFPMFRNPTFLLWGWKIIWKIVGPVIGVFWLCGAVVLLFENGFDAGQQLFWLLLCLLLFSIFMVLWPLGYFLLALLYGGKDCLLFEMDRFGITQTPTPKQLKKDKSAGAIGGFLGAMSGIIGAVNAGRLLASRGSTSSKFAKVKSGRVMRRWSTIYLNEFFVFRAQIYAEPQDFDFVLNFIRSRVPPGVAARLQG